MRYYVEFLNTVGRQLETYRNLQYVKRIDQEPLDDEYRALSVRFVGDTGDDDAAWLIIQVAVKPTGKIRLTFESFIPMRAPHRESYETTLATLSSGEIIERVHQWQRQLVQYKERANVNDVCVN